MLILTIFFFTFKEVKKMSITLELTNLDLKFRNER